MGTLFLFLFSATKVHGEQGRQCRSQQSQLTPERGYPIPWLHCISQDVRGLLTFISDPNLEAELERYPIGKGLNGLTVYTHVLSNSALSWTEEPMTPELFCGKLFLQSGLTGGKEFLGVCKKYEVHISMSKPPHRLLKLNWCNVFITVMKKTFLLCDQERWKLQ